MGKFDGILMCTDLDGTLLASDKSISKENLEAIEYFKAEGGYFTFITGRMPNCAVDIYETIQPNAPFGCINGGGLYDHRKQAYVWTYPCPMEALELAADAIEHLPGIGVQPNTFDTVYFSRENAVMESFRNITHVPNIVRDLDEIEPPLAKILFGAWPESEMQALISFLNTHPKADKFDFIRSEESLYEILPKGSSKGAVLPKLAQVLDIDMEKTIALGDYNNDVMMLKTAKVGVAVKNACKEALEAADYVTVSNDEHAIAAVVAALDSGELEI